MLHNTIKYDANTDRFIIFAIGYLLDVKVTSTAGGFNSIFMFLHRSRKNLLFMKKTLKVMAMLISFFCCSMVANAQTWKMVYQNDENGETVLGDKQDLIQAALDGKDIRVAIVYPNIPGQIYTVPAENVWVRDGEVTIQNASQISVRNDLTVQSDPYHWIIMLNTQGKLNASRWLLGEHSSNGDSEDYVIATWYVR